MSNESSPLPLNICHDHLTKSEESLPDSNLLPMRLLVERLEIPPSW